MDIDSDKLYVVLSQFNPWWRGEEFFELPRWRRSAFGELSIWLAAPPTRRAVLISGARQIGKTTLLLQAVRFLLDRKVPAANILYVTFDHPILKLAGIDAVLDAWRQRTPRAEGPEYILVDEAQFIREWGTWIKHQVDFFRDRRIIFTGSAVPLLESDPESGVGRWHTIRLTTLSFYEYLKITNARVPELPPMRGLHEIRERSPHALLDIAELAKPYIAHFHEYLVRGGFPQTAMIENVTQAQRLLREDIVDKVLKRDMTALFGVRRILELEHTFLYLCLHGGGLLDMPALCSNLEVKRPTAQNFIDLLEATHLIYRLLPHGYGKEVLRGRCKVYVADPGIAPAVMLRGRDVIDNPAELGLAVETAVFKHLVTRFYARQVRFSYWRGRQDHEVDIVADLGTELVPFEVKYRSEPTKPRELKGLIDLCEQKRVERAYIVTRHLSDFGPVTTDKTTAQMTCIPAALLCYWTGEAETRIGVPEGASA
ncbi:MAG: ATP-binding protein [Acidobacteria bacterium]|nr:ATP-binding protein [Acidobacteriota bacterium]